MTLDYGTDYADPFCSQCQKVRELPASSGGCTCSRPIGTVGSSRAELPALRAVPEPPGSDTVAGLVATLREWQDVPDAGHVCAALAVAVTAEDREGEPAWLLLVGPPSSGKTETVRLLDTISGARLDEVSIGGLLSWTRKGKGKAASPAGVLTRVRHGLLTLGDLSTLLATSDRGGRNQVFAALRRVYDGHLVRDVAPPNGSTPDGALAWSGRLTIVGAVTGTIDTYAAHADALGSRWLYVRLPEQNTAGKRRASRQARRTDLDVRREQARAMATRVVTDARARLDGVTLPDDVADVIEDAALVCAWGRAAVPRNGYGRREIDGPPTVEHPPRLIRQLSTLARGLLALDCTPEHTATLCRRVALDSMPAERFAVLDVLALGAENATTATVGRAARLDRGVTRRALEELEAVGVVTAVRVGQEPDDESPDRRRCTWRLDGDDGALIARVFVDTRSARTCLET